jgi:MFS transporter, SP family, general alpha glucoside:H+ symporter
LRSYLETLIVLFWGVGQLISYGVLDGLLGNTTIWAWRIPFAVQWVWPVIIIPLVIFCPESPWWYVRRGDLVNAEKSVKRLSSKAEESKAKETVALMVETTELERSMTEGASYIDCFRGTNLWRTEIGCVAWLSQALVGFAITSYATYFFEQAGLPVASAYKLTVGQGGLHFLGVLFSVFLTGKFGRRPIFLWGCIFMSCCWWIVAFVAFAPQSAATGYASATIYLIWYVAYELTIGPIAFIIVAETSSTRLRSKSIALGRNAYNVFNIFSSTVAPYVLNPTQANWKGKSAFLAAGFCLICAAWSWFRLPECRGRTYEELDIMFAKGLKAREFAKYQIDHRTDVEAKLADIEHEHQE